MLFNSTYCSNQLILSAGRIHLYKFYKDLHKVDVVQHKKLKSYLLHNADTIYGKEFGFSTINNYEEYIQQVPIIEDWEQVEKYITQIEEGQQHVLSADAISFFEETSGSTGFSKLIPYNRSLKNEFSIALQVWMVDLSKAKQGAFAGKAYWSLSPALKSKKVTDGGIPIGLYNDAAYFNSFTAWLLSKVMAIDQKVVQSKQQDTFYSETMKQLLLTTDLSLVSVWSPTFFLQLDDYLATNAEALLAAIKKVNPAREQELKILLEAKATWKEIWTGLSCLSCWTDAQAAPWIPAVKHRLGNVFIQPKGLLSTEAVISIPLKNTPFPGLAYRSHFFEFRSTEDQTIHLAHQLVKDKNYEVIVTTAGGLYRYATKDVVQVVGHIKQLPLLKFLGRNNRTSDMVGEKVSEIQVNEIINRLIEESLLPPCMIFLKATTLKKTGQYIVYTEQHPGLHPGYIQELTEKFEGILCTNTYYLQALLTGQLLPMSHKFLPANFKDKLVKYYNEKRLIKDGDIKLPVLFLHNELREFDKIL